MMEDGKVTYQFLRYGAMYEVKTNIGTKRERGKYEDVGGFWSL